MGGYFAEIEPFRMPVPSRLIGICFILIEVYTGPAMMVSALAADFGPIMIVAACGSILDILGYGTLSLQAYIRGLAFTWNFQCQGENCIKNCTCFGVYGAQKLTIWVLLQDIIILVETSYVAYRIFSAM